MFRQRWEARHTRYQLKAAERLSWSVPEHEGHDDFVISLALCALATETALPPPAGSLQRAHPTPDDYGW